VVQRSWVQRRVQRCEGLQFADTVDLGQLPAGTVAGPAVDLASKEECPGANNTSGTVICVSWIIPNSLSLLMKMKLSPMSQKFFECLGSKNEAANISQTRLHWSLQLAKQRTPKRKPRNNKSACRHLVELVWIRIIGDMPHFLTGMLDTAEDRPCFGR